MARRFSVKARNTHTRKPRPVLLLIAEGYNVTETQYFRQVQKQHASYSIKFITPGSDTDPEGLLKKVQRFWEANDLHAENGDKGFIVLDLDCNDNKGRLIERLENGTEVARFIVSNPCSELWYLLHYKFTTHVYLNNAELIRDLRNYIPDYEKNLDVAGRLSEKTDTALANALRLQKHFEELGYHWPSNEENPRTDVPEILKAIEQMEGGKIDLGY